MTSQLPILDVCCGGRMFYFDKHDPRVVFMDNRVVSPEKLSNGQTFSVCPSIVGDFRKIPFGDASFNMVIFDPPHLLRVGEKSSSISSSDMISESSL